LAAWPSCGTSDFAASKCAGPIGIVLLVVVVVVVVVGVGVLLLLLLLLPLSTLLTCFGSLAELRDVGFRCFKMRGPHRYCSCCCCCCCCCCWCWCASSSSSSSSSKHAVDVLWQLGRAAGRRISLLQNARAPSVLFFFFLLLLLVVCFFLLFFFLLLLLLFSLSLSVNE